MRILVLVVVGYNDNYYHNCPFYLFFLLPLYPFLFLHIPVTPTTVHLVLYAARLLAKFTRRPPGGRVTTG